MYKIVRTDGRIAIFDWKGQIVYSVEPDALLLYEGIAGPRTDKVGLLNDDQLLIALAAAIKLPL